LKTDDPMLAMMQDDNAGADMITETTWIRCAHCGCETRACNRDINSGPLRVFMPSGKIDGATYVLSFTCDHCGATYRLPVKPDDNHA